VRYPLRQRAGLASPGLNMTIKVRRIPASASCAAAIAAEAAAQKLAAGTDIWYDVFARSCIPYREYDAAMCEDTPNQALTVDDGFDNESVIPSLPGEAGPIASAWWVLTVPPGVAVCWLTVDTWLSSIGNPAAAYPGDTNLMILTPWDGGENGMHWPLSRERTDGEGAQPLDFGQLQLVNVSDDNPDPSDPTRLYTSKITNQPLSEGATYFIRVDCWNEENRGQIYRLRLSLSETAP
jgi:hypothetical protein